MRQAGAEVARMSATRVGSSPRVSAGTATWASPSGTGSFSPRSWVRRRVMLPPLQDRCWSGRPDQRRPDERGDPFRDEGRIAPAEVPSGMALRQHVEGVRLLDQRGCRWVAGVAFLLGRSLKSEGPGGKRVASFTRSQRRSSASAGHVQRRVEAVNAAFGATQGRAQVVIRHRGTPSRTVDDTFRSGGRASNTKTAIAAPPE